MRHHIQFTLTAAISASLLAACATAPKPIDLPASSLSAKTEIIDGSAIAFQISDGTCNKSGFKIAQKLSDGKYAPAQPIEISSSTFKFKSKNLKQTKFASSTKQLYVKSMPPGDYVITRIWCYDSNGRTSTSLFTKPDRVAIFGNFTVEPGQTNYIGALKVSRTYGKSSYPTFTIRDNSASAKPFFDEHYADKVAPMQVKLAERVGPGARAAGRLDRTELMKLVEEARARVAAKKAAEDAKTGE